MRKLCALVAALAVGLGGMAAAEARTINLGSADPGDAFDITIAKKKMHGFEDFIKFRLAGPASITASFASFLGIVGTSFEVALEQKKNGSWSELAEGTPQGSSYSFALNLLKGSYRWEIEGLTGQHSGYWKADMSVAAVPEADVWTMLLIGAGLVGYQLRRKQSALNQLPFA